MSTAHAATAPRNLRLLAAGLSGGLGVVLGALGSHAFYNLMDAAQLKSYNVANQYHLVHSIAMVIVAATAARVEGCQAAMLHRAYACFAVGTVLVSGSRYVLSTVHKPAFLAHVPPVGAALLGLGWACVALAGL